MRLKVQASPKVQALLYYVRYARGDATGGYVMCDCSIDDFESSFLTCNLPVMISGHWRVHGSSSDHPNSEQRGNSKESLQRVSSGDSPHVWFC